jgi:hypothetical protein
MIACALLLSLLHVLTVKCGLPVCGRELGTGGCRLMTDGLAVHCSEFNVPMEVPDEYLDEAMLQNPMIADFLDQAKAKGRDDIYKARLQPSHTAQFP